MMGLRAFVQYDGSQSSFTADNKDALFPGKAVLDDQLFGFLMLDMLGLFASLSIILLLICVDPRKKRMLTKLLKWVMWIAVFCTAIAFLIGLFGF